MVVNQLFHNMTLCIVDNYYQFWWYFIQESISKFDIDNLCGPKKN
jgi:hypothetical protein